MRRWVLFLVGAVTLWAVTAAPALANLSASVTVNKRGTVNAEGIATISGTATCTGATGTTYGYIELLLDQQGGLAASATQVTVTCSDTSWSAPLGSFEAQPFTRGLANAHASLTMCDDVTCVFPGRVDQTVRLRKLNQ